MKKIPEELKRIAELALTHTSANEFIHGKKFNWVVGLATMGALVI
jgi:hypothetical protein